MPHPTSRHKATTGELVQAGDPANNAVRVNIVAGAGSGGTAATDDSAFTPGGTSITPVGGTYRSVLDAVDDGDTGAFAMTQTRAIFANIRDDAGDSAMDGANNALRVNIVAGAGSGGTAMTDDTAFTPAGTSITPMGAFADDTGTDSVDEGDGGVVRMSLDRILYSQTPDRVATGTLGALDAAVTVELKGAQGAGVAIVTTNLNATVIPEVSFDGGTSWEAGWFFSQFSWGYSASLVFSGGASTRQWGILTHGGVSHVRVRVSAYTSGTTTTAMVRATMAQGVELVQQAAQDPFFIAGWQADGAAANSANRPVRIGGTDGSSNIQAILTDTSGRLETKIHDGTLFATVRDTGSSDSLNVAIVDASGNQITSFGGGTQYVEDDAAPANPTAPAQSLVRQDTPATLTTTDGDIVTRRGTNYGAAYTQIVSSTGSFVDTFGGGTQYTEDAAAAADPVGNATILVRQDTPATLVSTDGDNVAQRGTNYGAAYTQIVTSAGAFVDTFGGGTQYTEGDVDATITGTAAMMEVAGNTLQPVQGTVADGLLVNLGTNNDVTVTGTVTANAGTGNFSVVGPAADGAAVSGNPVRIAGKDGGGLTQDILTDTDGNLQIDVLTLPANASVNVAQWNGVAPTAAAALAENMANPTAPPVGAFLMGLEGTTWDRLTSSGGQLLAAQGATVAADNGWRVQGATAADSPIATAPVLAGWRASNSLPSAVSADSDVVQAWANRNGALVVAVAPHIGLNSDPYNLIHETAQYTTTQTSTVLVAGGASEKLVVTKVQIQVGGTTAGTLQLYFGTAAYSRGTSRAIFDGEFAPSTTLKPGVVMDGPFISGTNGDDLLVTTSAAINPLTITVWYYVVV